MVKDIWNYLKKNKKWWLLPFLAVLFLLGPLIIFGSVAPVPIIEKFVGKISEEKLINSLKEFEEIKKLYGTSNANSLGFKDDEWKIEKPPNTYRIIALGDSMTEGLGVAINDAWPQQLEKKLNNFNVSQKFEVLNMGGQSSGTTSEELEIFKEFGLKYSPNMVVLQYYQNDWESPVVHNKTEEVWKKYKKGEYQLTEKIEKTIKELNISERGISWLIANMILNEYYKTANFEEEWNRWVKPYLIELIEICKNKNIKLMIITWDTDDDLGPKSQKEKLTVLLQNYNIPFYDFSEHLRSGEFCPSAIRLPDCHLTPLGYEIVANKTLDILIREFE